MYCCRVVLEQFRDEAEVNSSQLSGESSSHVLTNEISPGMAAGVYQGSNTTLEDRRSGVGLEESRRTAKGYFNGTLKWLKKFSCMPGTQDDDSQHAAKSGDKPLYLVCNFCTLGILGYRFFSYYYCALTWQAELRDALGLVGDFTYEELRIATNNFSSVIGSGGSGQVYLGMLVDGRRIAVKVAYPREGRAGQHVLTQELRIASQLRHRNIVPLFGWCQDRGNLLLVYEYMPNGDMAKHMVQQDESVVGWQQRYKVVCQLAAALKYLHQDSGYMQIVHRDVKTSNIMLDSEWNARLGDCGIAVSLQDGDSSVECIAGTIGFMAPESVIESRVSPASDIYSFGVTVLEIATGKRVHYLMEEGMSLENWVWKLYQEGEVMQASDVRLRGNFYEEEMKRLLVLGLICTNVDPQARPSIEEVLRILSKASEPPSPESRAHLTNWLQGPIFSTRGSSMTHSLSTPLSQQEYLESSFGSPASIISSR